MLWAAALFTLATGVFLPTLDVYSDLMLMCRLFIGNYYVSEECKRVGVKVPPHQRAGSVMLIPLLLSWVLVTRQWYKLEHGMRQKLKTLPLLILQVYPQWRALRVLYYAKWKKHRGWQKMKEEWETGITHIGKCRMYNKIINRRIIISHHFRGLFRVRATSSHCACYLTLQQRIHK